MDITTFKEQQTEFTQSLPSDIKFALKRYTSNLYTKINNYLENSRQSNSKELEDIVDKIDLAFESAPSTKSDLVLYRGLELHEIQDDRRYTHPNVMMGYKGKYLGYISTSLSYEAADKFTRGTCCTLKITVPKGSKLIYLEDLTQANEEFEVLMPRGCVLQIDGFSTEPSSGSRIILSSVSKPRRKSFFQKLLG